MQNYRFRATGIIKISGNHEGNHDLIVYCDDELGNYYRYLVQRSIGLANKVAKPMWKYHISVIVGKYEVIPANLLDLWRQYNNVVVEYWYSNNIQSDGLYFWLPVYCPYLLDIREQFGFSRQPHYSLHLTIGNLK